MTIAEAKELYFKYKCSEFAMGRESWDKYNQFKLLNINEQTKIQWKIERMREYLEDLKVLGDLDTFISIETLFLDRKDQQTLAIIQESLDYMDYTPTINMIYVAETILGRGSAAKQDGMVFVARQLGDAACVKDLLAYAQNLIGKLAELNCREDVAVSYKERIVKLEKKLEQIRSLGGEL